MFGLQDFIPSWELKLLVSALIALVAFALAYLVSRGRRRFSTYLSHIIVDLVSSVIYIGIVIGTTLAIADIWGQTDTLLDQVGFLRLDARAPEFVITVVVVIAIQVFAGIATRLLDDLTTESQALTEHQREVGLRVTNLTLWTVGLIVILGVWDVDLTGLLVGAGFLGIVIGLASRQTIGSLLAGFVLMFSRPFEVGDWVVVDDHEGVVSDITMMSTRIQAFDGEYIVVPNDVVSSETVVNRSRQGRLRAEIEVGIDFDADVHHARDVAIRVANELADETQAIRDSPEPDVLVRRLADSAVVLVVRLWIDRPTSGQVNRIRDDLMCNVTEAFKNEGIKIPYPQRELSGREETGGFQITGTAESVEAPTPEENPTTERRESQDE